MSDLLRVPSEEMAGVSLASIMTRSVLVVHPDESLLDALDKMTNLGVGRLPVVDRDSGRLIGLVTRTNIIKTYDRTVKDLSASDRL